MSRKPTDSPAIEEEKIEAMGEESESKGRKATQEIMDQEKEAAQRQEDDALNRLDMHRQRILTYTDILLNALHELVLRVEMPATYQWGVWFDGKGVVLAIVDRFGNRHRRAFIPARRPIFDRAALHTLARWAADIYDGAEGRLQTKLWTPNQNKKN